MSNAEADIIEDLREEVVKLREEVQCLQNGADPERLLTKKGAADLLAVSERTVDTLIAKGDITSLKIGRARRIPRNALLSYIRAKTNGNAKSLA